MRTSPDAYPEPGGDKMSEERRAADNHFKFGDQSYVNAEKAGKDHPHWSEHLRLAAESYKLAADLYAKCRPPELGSQAFALLRAAVSLLKDPTRPPNLKTAKHYLDKSARIYKMLNFPLGYGRTQRSLGTVASIEGRQRKALKFLERAIEEMMPSGEMRPFNLLAECALILGHAAKIEKNEEKRFIYLKVSSELWEVALEYAQSGITIEIELWNAEIPVEAIQGNLLATLIRMTELLHRRDYRACRNIERKARNLIDSMNLEEDERKSLLRYLSRLQDPTPLGSLPQDDEL